MTNHWDRIEQRRLECKANPRPVTNQEIFNRAYEGLASQGFTQALVAPNTANCVYVADDGRRCAWGWVDIDLDRDSEGPVSSLRNNFQGVAAHLEQGQVGFAMALQEAHDSNPNPNYMEEALRKLADLWHLTIPMITLDA